MPTSSPTLSPVAVPLDPVLSDRLLEAIASPGAASPLAHWAVLAPACDTGTAVRVRFRRPLPRHGRLEVLERADVSAHGEPIAVQELLVDAVLCTETVTYSAPGAGAGAALRGTRRQLAPGVVNVPKALELLAGPGNAQNRLALVLLAGALQRLHSPALAALHADFHADVPGSPADLVVEFDAMGPSRAGFRIGRPDGSPIVSGALWSGCGPAGSSR